MPKGFILTIFVNSCIVCCFGIVSDIVLCVCCFGTKKYYLLGCPLSGLDILCTVVVEIVNLRYVLMILLLRKLSFGGLSPESKVVGGLPASNKECRSFCKLFLILSLLILFIEKFACPSSIIDSMAKDRRSFVLTT